MDDRDRDIIAIAQAGLDNVRPDHLLRRAGVHVELGAAASEVRGVTVIALGKAALSMAESVVPYLNVPAPHVLVGVPYGYTSPWIPSQGIQVVHCGHPYPDENSARFGQMALDLAIGCAPDNLLIVLLSGGASSISFLPPPGIGVAAIRDLVVTLSAAGVPIGELNSVRKHLSLTAGGRLAAAAHPTPVLAYVLSDVPGDVPEHIGSGPTVGASTVAADAMDILRRYDCIGDIAPPVLEWLTSGEAEAVAPGDSRLGSSVTKIIGTVGDALAGAADCASRIGYNAIIATQRVSGEAREVGESLARYMDAPAPQNSCYIWGGETVVSVAGTGKGGRNLEVALGAAMHIDESHSSSRFVSLATDGVDGSTDYAGALVGPDTMAIARRQSLDPRRFLANNDSFAFFNRVGGLIRTGPTHTNVMDIQIGLAG